MPELVSLLGILHSNFEKKSPSNKINSLKLFKLLVASKSYLGICYFTFFSLLFQQFFQLFFFFFEKRLKIIWDFLFADSILSSRLFFPPAETSSYVKLEKENKIIKTRTINLSLKISRYAFVCGPLDCSKSSYNAFSFTKPSPLPLLSGLLALGV